jgi:hypothetical protein
MHRRVVNPEALGRFRKHWGMTGCRVLDRLNTDLRFTIVQASRELGVTDKRLHQVYTEVFGSGVRTIRQKLKFLESTGRRTFKVRREGERMVYEKLLSLELSPEPVADGHRWYFAIDGLRVDVSTAKSPRSQGDYPNAFYPFTVTGLGDFVVCVIVHEKRFFVVPSSLVPDTSRIYINEKISEYRTAKNRFSELEDRWELIAKGKRHTE